MELRMKRLSKDAKIPVRATDGSGYYDVFSSQDISLDMRSVAKVPTGWAFEVPEGYILDVRPRGSLSSKRIVIANSPGTLDSDYRGGLFILLLNLSMGEYDTKKGDRIAQVNLLKIHTLNFVEVEELSRTERGEGALGSTGR